MTAQLLGSHRPTDVVDVVTRLGYVQLDPTSAVSRSEHLVLWSRLGARYRPHELLRRTYETRELFEHVAYVYPASDFALYRPAMLSWPRGSSPIPRRIRDWLTANDRFRAYILDELRARGPLRTRQFEDRAAVPWPPSRWSERSVGMMLEFLAARGDVAVTGRVGHEKLWDLAERVFPTTTEPVDPDQARRVLARRRLRALGVLRATPLMRDMGTRVAIEGLDGVWIAEQELLDSSFVGRTAVVSPFDQLIHDRKRANELFDFDYRLEIYVPRAKRRWGYYVLPVLSGDRLVARVDARADREARMLRIGPVVPEPGTRVVDLEAARLELDCLAGWLRLDGVQDGLEPG